MLPPGAFPPGAYQPGPYPPGAYPPGALPPGAYPPNAFRPGGMPPNLPPSWIPPIAYQAGRYVFVTEPRPHGLALAPLGRRLVARLIDILAVAVASAALLFYPIHQWLAETGPYYRSLWHAVQDSAAGQAVSTPDTPTLTSRGQWLQLAILFMLMLIWLVYEVPFIANHGQTLGKRVMGIKVVKLESDDRIGYGRAIRRWNTLGIATLLWQCAGVGFILQFIDCLSPTMNRPLRLAFHDRSAATVVVRLGSQLPTPPTSGTPTASGVLPPGSPAPVGGPPASDDDWSRPPADDAPDSTGGAP